MKDYSALFDPLLTELHEDGFDPLTVMAFDAITRPAVVFIGEGKERGISPDRLVSAVCDAAAAAARLAICHGAPPEHHREMMAEMQSFIARRIANGMDLSSERADEA